MIAWHNDRTVSARMIHSFLYHIGHVIFIIMYETQL